MGLLATFCPMLRLSRRCWGIPFGSFRKLGGYLRVPLKGYYKSTIRVPLKGSIKGLELPKIKGYLILRSL